MSCVYGVPPIILHVHTLTFPPFSTFSRSVRVANGTDERRERRKEREGHDGGWVE